MNTDLRCRQPDPIFLPHGIPHVLDELIEIGRVKLSDLRRYL
jgi:hypothetical protein